MPIFAKNISVGGVKPPTKIVEEIKSSFISAKNITIKNKPENLNNVPEPTKLSNFNIKAKNIIIKNKKQVQEIVESPPVEQPVVEEKYLLKTDGDLIRHINKKSAYLRDMLEVSN